ncbi:MAG: TetR/AcrR family transcriptional regulator [Solirubrobacteraceae bacterium]|nr:TetR/AcrR family transcriptional regulator [Solirubrobacteraceae bacterium]
MSTTDRPVPAAGTKRSRTRRGVLDAVDRLLAEGNSYTELSVARIIAESGISRSTFYTYFSDKGALLRSAVDDLGPEVNAAGQAWQDVDATIDRDGLRAILGNVIRTYQPHARMMAEVYAAGSHDPLVREKVDELMGHSIRGLRRHIERGQRAGFVDRRLLPLETATWLVWMFERTQHQDLAHADDAEIDAMIDALTDLVWDTLYAPARR